MNILNLSRSLLALSMLLLLTALITPAVVSQDILRPVKWTFEQNEAGPGEAELSLIANIDRGWHVYSMDLPTGGPIPTSFYFTESEDYELVGEMEAPDYIEKFDKAFEMILGYYEGKAVFTQKIKFEPGKQFNVTGELEFMACDDKRCLPPDYVDFDFAINGGAAGVTTTASGSTNTAAGTEETAAFGSEKLQVVIEEIGDEPADETDGGSLLAFFLIALGVGFVGLLTPCVYPMIPMTVSFFMNSSQNKMKARSQALFFGVSIIFIYTVIGVLVSVIFGADAIKSVSSHWLTNLIFFLLFAFFAASFFGMFEIVLPSWLTNKSDKQVDKGGYIGSFFMALTLVLVSFSCTAPFIGGILVEASTGEFIKPIVGMFGFSLAFGVVFTVLAMFPSWLGKMPKSGGWLNSVKVILAFLILAIGMKYLLVPNVALHWGVTREIYIGVWIVLFTLMGFYLLGKIKFAHDSPVDSISVPRLALVIVTFSFVLYLVPGLIGAPLKAISGYLPSESSWDLNEVIMDATRDISVISSGEVSQTANMCDEPRYGDLFHLPHGLKGYYDYEQGMACAKKLNKPVFLDIKGHACTNCKVIEKNIWSDPAVLKKLREEFVIIALYVDDKTKLAEEYWVTSTFDGKVKNTIGKRNADFQITRFGVNAQPYYVILDHNGKALAEPVAFENDVDKYAAFLDEGIAAFKK